MEPILPNKIISVPDMFPNTAKPEPAPAGAGSFSPANDEPAIEKPGTEITDGTENKSKTGPPETTVTNGTEGKAEETLVDDRVYDEPLPVAERIEEEPTSIPVYAAAPVIGDTKDQPISEAPVAGEEHGAENSQSEITAEISHGQEIKKKGMKYYLLQGLITFLAVALGLVAWNIWENVADNRRAAELASAYYHDVKTDAAMLKAAVLFNKHKLTAMDSTLAELHLADTAMKDTIIAHGMMAASAVSTFNPSVEGYEQIKSSGPSKYFSPKMTSLMNEYDREVRVIVLTEDINTKFILGQYFPFTIKYFNAEVDSNLLFGKPIAHKVYFADRSLIFKKQVMNYVLFIKLLKMRSIEEYEKMLALSDKVLNELKSEYGLAD